MTFCIEHIQCCKLTSSKAKAIKVHRAVLWSVHPAQVQRQTPVDKDPHVVIATESEALSTLVRKVVVKLKSEEIVVTVCFLISTALTSMGKNAFESRISEPVTVRVNVRLRSSLRLTVSLLWYQC